LESLRWILLAAGIVFVLVIYILGRNRRQRNHSLADELEDDLPAFTARNLDDLDEGVGEVRIITGAGAGSDFETAENLDDISAVKESMDDDFVNKTSDDQLSDKEPAEDDAAEKNKKYSDIVVLYILPKGDQLLIGSQINSSAQAMGLTFGEMNIFHFKRNGRNVFSLANMLEPGSFDANTIHDLKTTGLTIFMQIKGDDPLDDLTEMLQRSYQLAGLLDARLCNHKRKPLTEQDAEDYRTQVSHFTSQ